MTMPPSSEPDSNHFPITTSGAFEDNLAEFPVVLPAAPSEPELQADAPLVPAEPATESEASVPEEHQPEKTVSKKEKRQQERVARLNELLPPKPEGTRYLTLDIVRGMACLMLMFYHATFYAEHSWQTSDPSTWTLGGLAINLVGRLWMGVPMFFVVSGYCIAASIDSLRRKPHSLSNYFYRRFRRIYPPLWAGFVFAILVTALVSLNSTTFNNCLQLPRMETFTFVDWVANFTATASWLPTTIGSESNHLLKNTWTLCYEEQFYAVTGMLLILASRRFFLACYVIAAGTIIVRHACRFYGIPISGFFFDGHWLLFVAGILLYQRLHYMSKKQARFALAALIVGAVYGVGERLWTLDAHDKHIGEYIFIACSFAIFLSAIKRWDKQVAEHWTLKPFRWCGKISYSLYLTHFPVTVLLASILATMGLQDDLTVFLVTIPLCLLISIPIAMLFYRLVECKYLNTPAPQ